MMGFLAFERWRKHKAAQVYSWLARGDFGSIGRGSVIYPPFHSNNPGDVYVGRDCMICAGGWLDTFAAPGHSLEDARIEIGDNAYIGFRSHIIACHHISIGRHVVLADGVYITDNLHGYEDISRPVMAQPLKVPGPVAIEDEVWLGEGVCVMPDVTIGKHSVVGSNSVVTRDIPAYSVAVGIPARVIKRYEAQTEEWVSTR